MKNFSGRTSMTDGAGLAALDQQADAAPRV
jgi:hypothetical protein